MKKIVLTFGLISGALLSAMMAATIPFIDQIGMDRGMIVGYTTMVLAFMLVFFGVRSYRENIGGGQISFLRAVGVGLSIMAIAALCYVITWEILYFNVMPESGDKYVAHMITQLRASGRPAAEIEQEIQKINDFKALYDSNILFNAAVTFLEPLPVGLPMTLISALILRRKTRRPEEEPVLQN